MVNVLHDFYISERYRFIEDAFTEYSDIIQKNLDENHTEYIKYKWRWFKQYIESEIHNHY